VHKASLGLGTCLLDWAASTDETWLVYDQVGCTELASLVQHSSLAGCLSSIDLGLPCYTRLHVVG